MPLCLGLGLGPEESEGVGGLVVGWLVVVAGVGLGEGVGWWGGQVEAVVVEGSGWGGVGGWMPGSLAGWAGEGPAVVAGQVVMVAAQ